MKQLRVWKKDRKQGENDARPTTHAVLCVLYVYSIKCTKRWKNYLNLVGEIASTLFLSCLDLSNSLSIYVYLYNKEEDFIL